MSTRTNIHFNHGMSIRANIYRHSDGYPGEVVDGEETEYGVLSDLLRFFRELKAQVHDTRMGDAEYLAAKFLVWQSQEIVKAPTFGRLPDGTYGDIESTKHPLEFLGVAPCVEDHGDIEYIYEVDCDDRDAQGFPAVRWKEARFADLDDQTLWKVVYLSGAPKAA